MNQTREGKKRNERPDSRNKICPFSVLSASFLLLLSPMMGCSSKESPTSTIPQDSGAQTKTQTIGGYKAVDIGGVIWMAENLNIETNGSYCYNDVPDNCSKYGRLYTYEAAQTACPDGWHLATASEWDYLNLTVGTNSSASYYLKSMTGWWTDVGNGNDAYGFTALPGGIRNIGGVYSDLTLAGYFWATDGSSASYELHYNTSNLAQQTNIPGETAMSVRCVSEESRSVFKCYELGLTDESYIYNPETTYHVYDDGFAFAANSCVKKNRLVIGNRVTCKVPDITDGRTGDVTIPRSWVTGYLCTYSNDFYGEQIRVCEDPKVIDPKVIIGILPAEFGEASSYDLIMYYIDSSSCTPAL